MKWGKLFKPLVLATIIFGLIGALAGCGKTSQPPAAQPSSKEIKEIKIGLLNSMTGAFAPAGALAGYRGQQIAIDIINEKGGVLGKYKVVPVAADAQSNPDIAIREAERLINVERVPVIAGVFSSAIAVPVAQLCERNKTIFWDHIAISDAVVKGKHQQYVFRPQPMGSQWGTGTVDFINSNYKLFGVSSPADLKVAILHEDGPYGVSCAAGNEERIKKYGMKLVLKQSYSVDIKDMTPIITKLKAAEPDVIFHTGYFPDLVLFFRQARELGLKTKAILGHGAGHAALPEIGEQVGKDVVQYVFNIDPPPAQIIDPKKLAPGLGDLNAELLKRVKEKYNTDNPATHYTQGFVHTWILLDKVLPVAIEKYGGVTPDAIRKACLDLDIPEGGTGEGYGVKFAPPEDEYAGQNIRAFPAVMQWVGGKWRIVWPENLKTAEPVLPLPKDSPFAK
ncbi:MAG: ABC transporter substrate-binding protein, partial [Bacillota bacterium]